MFTQMQRSCAYELSYKKCDHITQFQQCLNCIYCEESKEPFKVLMQMNYKSNESLYDKHLIIALFFVSSLN